MKNISPGNSRRGNADGPSSPDRLAAPGDDRDSASLASRSAPVQRGGHGRFPASLFSGCSSDDDFLMDPVDSGTSQTRAVTNSDGTLTITFDDFLL